jgi:hypothetical protein
MTRGIVSASLKHQVREKYNSRCYACGFSICTILRVHHLIPVSLGGTDKTENLVLLCPNCHTLVHLLSSKRFDNREVSDLLVSEHSQEAIGRITELSEEIRQARQRIRQSGNIWSADNPDGQSPYSIEEAIVSVAYRNKYPDEKREQLRKVFQLALSHIPRELKSRCSYRLLKRGSYISINLMNYLLYRSPGYGDLGGEPTYDCFLIFTNDITDHFKAFDERNVFSFSYFGCVNLGLSFSEVLALSDAEWEDFGKACQMAAEARKSRNWVSNIQILQ